jgi:hypothetical protein
MAYQDITYERFEKMTRAELIEKVNLAFGEAQRASQAPSHVESWTSRSSPSGPILYART